VTGFFLLLQVKKSLVKYEVGVMMRGKLAQDELVLFKFSLEQSEILLRWEHPGEFEFLGEMYDVYVRDCVGDSVYLWCWWDREETALNEHLGEMSNTLLPDKLPYTSALYRSNNFVSTPFLIGQLLQPQLYIPHSQILRPCEINHYRSPSLDPPEPPPRTA
jgi:hypothetical protein